MAANATGHRQTDHLKIMALAEAAADFAREVLAPGGTFLCKVLQGGTEATLLAALKRDFARVRARQAGGEPHRIRPSFICWRRDFAASVPSWKFARPCGTLSCELRNCKGHWRRCFHPIR